MSEISIIPPDVLSANLSLPATMFKNWDLIQKPVGFMNTSLVPKYLNTIALDTIIVQNLGRNPITDRGGIITLRKRRRNITLRPFPDDINATVYYDIDHGTESAIGGVCYVLVLIDKAITHLYAYGLQTHKQKSILQAMEAFINDIGCKSTIMWADRDFKLIGGEGASHLETTTLHNKTIDTNYVSGAPDGHQNQNGLIESHWKKITTLARS